MTTFTEIAKYEATVSGRRVQFRFEGTDKKLRIYKRETKTDIATGGTMLCDWMLNLDIFLAPGMTAQECHDRWMATFYTKGGQAIERI